MKLTKTEKVMRVLVLVTVLLLLFSRYEYNYGTLAATDKYLYRSGGVVILLGIIFLIDILYFIFFEGKENKHKIAGDTEINTLRKRTEESYKRSDESSVSNQTE